MDLYCILLRVGHDQDTPVDLRHHPRYFRSYPDVSLAETSDFVPWRIYDRIVHPETGLPTRGWTPLADLRLPASDLGWSGCHIFSVSSLLDAVWPGPLLLCDDHHSSVFVQTSDVYVYACSLRGAPSVRVFVLL